MVDVFEQSFSATRRLAAVQASMIVTAHRLPRDFRLDLEQDDCLSCGENTKRMIRGAGVGAPSKSNAGHFWRESLHA